MPDQTTPSPQDNNVETSDAAQQQDEAQFDVKVEDAGTLKKRLTVTVSADRIAAKRDEMFGELGQTAQVPGFRVGHAPRRLIEKRFGKEITDDVRNALIGESMGKAVEKAGLKMLGEPEIDLGKIELPEQGDLSYGFDVEIMPDFELPALEGIEVRKPVIELTDERIDGYIDQIRESRAKYEQTDKPAHQGDTIVCGAKISGEGIEPLERPGLTLRAAPGQIEGLPLVDLGKELTGKKAGDTVSIEVKAPVSHPNEAWREKELKVELSISQVRRRILPELNEEFASSMGFEGLKELREYIVTQSSQRIETEVRQDMREQVRQYLLDNAAMDLPQAAAARHCASVLRRRYIDLLYRGMPREKIEENLAQLQAAADQQAQREMKLSFILAAVAEKYELKVDEAEVNARIARMAGEYGRRPERLRQELSADGTISALEDSLKEEKALEKLLELAKITEVSDDQAVAKKTKPKKSRKPSDEI